MARPSLRPGGDVHVEVVPRDGDCPTRIDADERPDNDRSACPGLPAEDVRARRNAAEAQHVAVNRPLGRLPPGVPHAVPEHRQVAARRRRVGP
jgi:hypothetical protein